MLAAIFTTLIVTIIVATVTAMLKSRWLYIIAPKLYMHTPLSSGGQIVSLTAYNAGLLSEEDVAINFRPGFKFELIATSKSTLTIQGLRIVIPKLSRAESVQFSLLVEGKSFDVSDIEVIESKATTGKVVPNKEKASAYWEGLIAFPLVLIFLGLPFLVVTFVGAESKVSAFKYFYDKIDMLHESTQLAGYKVTTNESYGHGVLEGAIEKSNIKISVQSIIRRGNILGFV